MFLTEEEMAFSKVKALHNPKVGQKYFCIACKLGGLTIKEDIFVDDATDQLRIENHNMFESHSDAAIILNEINNIFKGLGDKK